MTSITVSRGAVRRNLEKLRAMTDARIMAVLKCNGYGMGLVEFARLLKTEGVRLFAVSRAEEATRLRSAGFDGYLLLLSPVWDRETVLRLAEQRVTLTVASLEHASAMSWIFSTADLHPSVHLAVDTGMHRYGFTRDELEKFDPTIQSFAIEGVFTHFYAAVNDALTEEQHADFIGCLDTLTARHVDPGIVHCCASMSFLRHREMHHDMVRLGSALVGTPEGLERVWRFETAAASVKSLKKGSPLGYGGWTLKRDALVASLPVGFSDGMMLERFEPVGFSGALRRFAKDVLRPASPIRVFFRGRELPILGGAGTTHLSVDATWTDAKPGDIFVIESNPMFLSPDIERKYQEEL